MGVFGLKMLKKNGPFWPFQSNHWKIQKKSENSYFWSQDAAIWVVISTKIMLIDWLTNFGTFWSQNVQQWSEMALSKQSLKNSKKVKTDLEEFKNYHKIAYFWGQDAAIWVLISRKIMLSDCLTNFGSFWSQNFEKTRPE